MRIAELRDAFHEQVFREIVRLKDSKKYGIFANFADKDSKASVMLARGVVSQLNYPHGEDDVKGQTAGKQFETAVCKFLKNSFNCLNHIRPGDWYYSVGGSNIGAFAQYKHLAYLTAVVEGDALLEAALGGDYLIKPDVLISRAPLSDGDINAREVLLSDEEQTAAYTPLRAKNHEQTMPLLHASVSCKWTIRSDRAQNTRAEALNLIRNRKGHLPHVVAVTAEPLPSRLAALALGTGDLDCVYHFALPELVAAAEAYEDSGHSEMLQVMIEGNRLRDISDLPFDLAA